VVGRCGTGVIAWVAAGRVEIALLALTDGDRDFVVSPIHQTLPERQHEQLSVLVEYGNHSHPQQRWLPEHFAGRESWLIAFRPATLSRVAESKVADRAWCRDGPRQS
jgi:hypothetical protein